MVVAYLIVAVGYFLAQFSSVEECYRLVASSQIYLSSLFVPLSTK